MFFSRCGSLVGDHAVNFDARVRADKRARAASYTFVRVQHECEMITAVVDLLGLQRKNIRGTCDNTQVATLAAVHVDGDGSVYLFHCY